MSGARGRNLGRLVSSPKVVFDTTIPRYMAKLGCVDLLAAMLGDRAVVPLAVDLELKSIRRKIPGINDVVGERGCMAVRSLDDEQERRAAALRIALPQKQYPPRASENLGEAQAIILAQDNQWPLVLEDWDGTVAAIRRKVEVFASVHVLLVAAITGHCTDSDAWTIYRDLIVVAQLGVPRKSGWDASDASKERFLAHLQAIRAARK